jgi:hypothetical protein
METAVFAKTKFSTIVASCLSFSVKVVHKNPVLEAKKQEL